MGWAGGLVTSEAMRSTTTKPHIGRVAAVGLLLLLPAGAGQQNKTVHKTCGGGPHWGRGSPPTEAHFDAPYRALWEQSWPLKCDDEIQAPNISSFGVDVNPFLHREGSGEKPPPSPHIRV